MTGFYFAQYQNQYHGPAMLQKTPTQDNSSCQGNPIPEVCLLVG